eukprot:6191709-Pleurochrysis_carterae.AAC.5
MGGTAQLGQNKKRGRRGGAESKSKERISRGLAKERVQGKKKKKGRARQGENRRERVRVKGRGVRAVYESRAWPTCRTEERGSEG